MDMICRMEQKRSTTCSICTSPKTTPVQVARLSYGYMEVVLNSVTKDQEEHLCGAGASQSGVMYAPP